MQAYTPATWGRQLQTWVAQLIIYKGPPEPILTPSYHEAVAAPKSTLVLQTTGVQSCRPAHGIDSGQGKPALTASTALQHHSRDHLRPASSGSRSSSDELSESSGFSSPSHILTRALSASCSASEQENLCICCRVKGSGSGIVCVHLLQGQGSEVPVLCVQL